MKYEQHKVYGDDHGRSGGTGSSHIPDSHMYDHHDYEELDFRAILQFVIGLIAIVAVSYVSMYGMLKIFEANYETSDPPLSPVAVSGWNNPGLEVQQAPHVDLITYQEKVDSVLEGKGAGSVSVEEAMKAVVEEGLPYQEKSQDSSPPAEDGDDESSEVSTPTDE
ncbi:MAG: hypothetical protein J4G05_08170 [Chlorobi bacterium]|nr:hypothetical protein [Chlorobiota bacterium]